MPKGQIYINGIDAYEEWGISMDTQSLSALMTPPPNKTLPENKSRLRNGKEVAKVARKVDERDVTLTINLTAPTEEEFIDRYARFCEVLAEGVLRINTQYQPGVYYNFEYQSCNQFTQFMRGIASFSLKLNEPDPTNRK